MITIAQANPALETLLRGLPDGLRQHLATVRDIAVGLALFHGVDPAQAEVSALSHDLARAMSAGELRERARAYGLTVHPVEEQLTVLLHGPVGAEMLRREYGVDNPEVLEAVRWHSTLSRGLGPLATVVFLADKLDPQKGVRYPFLDRVRQLSGKDLGAATLLFLQEELGSLIASGRLVHPASVEARNELLERGGEA